MEFESVIGLEVHAELLTETKIYCSCSTKFQGKANTQVCPVCMGLPGSLPHLNKKVVEFAIKTGLALNCDITRKGRMDRKNYFYPDCPKNYQITQDELPICRNGYIDIDLEDGSKKRIGIERIHIEEDAGKLLHTKAGSLVDFNRAGVPLIEIVSKPEIKNTTEATAYLLKLKSILFAIGVSDCKMEQGSLRCDGNVSIMEKGSTVFGTRCEVKNLNSFKALEKALNYEMIRHKEVIENGGRVSLETRRWDEAEGKTFPMRSKELANDYRYFPEGDLVTISVSEETIEEIRKTIPELPHVKRERFIKEYNIPEYDASILTMTPSMADFFEKTAKISKDPKASSNWLMGDISRLLNEDQKTVLSLKFKEEDLASLIMLINSSKISNAIGKIVLEEMYISGESPDKIIEEKGLIQNSDESEIIAIVNKVLDANAENVALYKSGKDRVVGFLIGVVMKESKGKANPKMVNKLMISEINKR